MSPLLHPSLPYKHESDSSANAAISVVLVVRLMAVAAMTKVVIVAVTGLTVAKNKGGGNGGSTVVMLVMMVMMSEMVMSLPEQIPAIHWPEGPQQGEFRVQGSRQATLLCSRSEITVSGLYLELQRRLHNFAKFHELRHSPCHGVDWDGKAHPGRGS